MLQFQNCHRTALSKGNILFIVPTQLFCIFKEILKRDLVHSATLPSDNTPQGTGQIQTHSSCTFSCKLLGLHLSARRNGQVTQVTGDTSKQKVPAPGTSRKSTCFQISGAPTSHKETESRAQKQVKNLFLHPSSSKWILEKCLCHNAHLGLQISKTWPEQHLVKSITQLHGAAPALLPSQEIHLLPPLSYEEMVAQNPTQPCPAGPQQSSTGCMWSDKDPGIYYRKFTCSVYVRTEGDYKIVPDQISHQYP